MDHTSSPSLAELFLSFLRLGVTSFGGPAMVVYIRKMTVEKKKWLDEETFHAGVALCQVIPGATAMQMAGYVGLRARGVAGAAVTYIGFALPAFFTMMLLSAVYIQSKNLPIAVSLFSGLQAIIVAIVANAAISFGRSYLKHGRDYAVAAFAAGLFILGTSPIFVILLAAFLGLMIYKDQTLQPRLTNHMDNPQTGKSILLILFAALVGFLLLFLLRRDLFELAVLMFRIDLFAFGGGLASLPLMLHEVVSVRSWMDYQTFMNGIALGQITPGPIVITAAFVGYLLYGPLGATIGAIGIFLPSFLMIVGTVPYYDRLGKSARFNMAVKGILCSFVGLLLSVTINFASNMTLDILHVAMATAALVMLLFGVDILWIFLIGGAVSLLIF